MENVGDAIVPSIYEATYIDALLASCSPLLETAANILSIGSGCGFTEQRIHQLFPDKFVVTTDPFIESCRICDEKGLLSIGCKAELLPFKDSYFDLVLMDGVLGHLLALFALDKAAHEVMRVLKHNGIAVIADDIPKWESINKNPRVPYIRVNDEYFFNFWKKIAQCDIRVSHFNYAKGTEGIISRRIGIVYFS